MTEGDVLSRLYPEAAALVAGIGREIDARADSDVRETLKGVIAVVQATMAKSSETDSDQEHHGADAFACIEKLLGKIGYNTVP